MFCSSSEGLALEGLLGAILFRAALILTDLTWLVGWSVGRWMDRNEDLTKFRGCRTGRKTFGGNWISLADWGFRALKGCGRVWWTLVVWGGELAHASVALRLCRPLNRSRLITRYLCTGEAKVHRNREQHLPR